MKIGELIKNLDTVSIIEFKNYLLENLTELCCKKNSNSKVISSYRQKDLFFVQNVVTNFIKMVKQKLVLKNIYTTKC